MGAGPAIKCLTCGTVIQSTYRHDYVTCSCDRDSDTWVAIDGGDSYTRGAFAEHAEWETVTKSAKLGDPDE